ncbi:MAG: hypothetical protein AAF675_04055 [Pseudomonadota bacterium]
MSHRPLASCLSRPPRFLRAETGAITLDWLTLVAGTLLLGFGAFVFVAGDVTKLAEMIGIETRDEVAKADSLWGAQERSPRQIGQEPRLLYYPDSPETDVAALTRDAAPMIDQPLEIGASGAFEPAIADPGASREIAEPMLNQSVAPEIASPNVQIEDIAVPREACEAVLAEAGAPPAADNPWVSRFIAEEQLCEEANATDATLPKIGAVVVD